LSVIDSETPRREEQQKIELGPKKLHRRSAEQLNEKQVMVEDIQSQHSLQRTSINTNSKDMLNGCSLFLPMPDNNKQSEVPGINIKKVGSSSYWNHGCQSKDCPCTNAAQKRYHPTFINSTRCPSEV